MSATSLGSLPAFGGSFDEVLIDKTGLQGPIKVEYRTKGLTKREMFAAMAMQGLSANPLFFMRENLEAVLRGLGLDGSTTAAQALALVAMQNADAMLAALSEPTP